MLYDMILRGLKSHGLEKLHATKMLHEHEVMILRGKIPWA
jgi:hypothetical protein